MNRRHGEGRRRTTLTLPERSLLEAERIARTRKVNLSTVISEALSEGLEKYAAAQRSQQVLDAYKRAFSEFTGEQMLALDGIVLDQPRKRKRW